MATIRFEDLGKPIQKLLLGLKSGYTDEDMNLMAYIHVRDMVKVFDDLNSQKAAEKIWKELKKELIKRQEEEKAAEQQDDQALQTTAEQIRAKEEQILAEKQADEEAELKRQKKREKKRKKAEEAAAAAALAEAEAEAEAEAAAEVEAEAIAAAGAAEEAEKQTEKERLKEERRIARQKKRDEKEAALRAEEERLREEEAAEEVRLQEEKAARKAERKRLKEEAARLRQDEEEIRQRREQAKAIKAAKPKTNLREQWDEHVKNHPLEFADDDGETHIVQEKIQISSKKPPSHFLKVKAVAVPSVVEEEETAFYTCDIHLHSGKVTSVRRRYNQFYEMRSSLGGTLDALDVQFPGKTLWKVKGPALDKRRLELEMWVNDVINKLSTTRSYAGVQLDAKQQ
eukprot:gene14298-21928_t